MGLVLGLNSCSVLDFDPTDRYNEMTVWKNKKNIELYLNSFYLTAEQYGEFGSRSFGTKNFSTDALTWMMKYSSDVAGYGTPNLLLFLENQISSASNALTYWSDCYERVRKVNEFLEGIDEYCTILTEDEKNAYKAEARFFRGYLYFLLTRAHESVIIYDKLGDWKQPHKARSSAADCWNFVKGELQFAYDYLPAQSAKGRLDKGAAAALMSRAMLYAEDWDAVIEASKNVMSLGYQLDPSYSNIFKSSAANRSVESIFQVDYMTENYSHSMDSKYAPSGDDANMEALGGGPTQEMVDHYEMADGTKFDWNNPVHKANPYANRDPRFYASVLYNGAAWKGRTVETFVGGKDGFAEYGSNGVPKTTVTGYYVRKFLDEKNLEFTTKNSTQSYVSMRLAEVKLNYAEALIKSATQKNIALAMTQINDIRERVGLPAVNAGNETAAMEALMHEREIELAFEGFHYWDLKRWRLAHTLLNNVNFHGVKITKEGSGNFVYDIVTCDGKVNGADQKRIFPQKYYSLPIPDAELTNNTLCTQLDAWK